MTSHPYEADATLTIDGDEQDVRVRGFVEIEPSRSRGCTATLDGDIDVRTGGDWFPADSVNLAHGDLERAEDALLTTAPEDDSAWAGQS